MAYVLLVSAFVIATCGLVYELIAGALASYLLGDSITQFSTIIGVYLFAMGIGSFLSQYVARNLIAVFVQVELLVGLVGGCSAALLFVGFEVVAWFRVLLYSLVGMTGILVGLEIPILMRILKNQFVFKDLVSRVFTVDYIGALFASLLFPLVLVPHLGLIRSAFLFGILNVLVALWTLYLLQREVVWAKLHQTVGVVILVGLSLGFVYSQEILSFAEGASYPDPVIHAASSQYQRIVLTQGPHDLRLFLNGNLQFSSRDEYRYHEALVHVGMSAVPQPRHVLVLGGGDGLAVREILRYPSVESVTLVDLDQAVTTLFSEQASLVELNGGALRSSKVQVVHADAFSWLRETAQQFDFIVVDFPDPSTYSIGKLYTDRFYRELRKVLAPEGVAVIQSTSPFVAKRSFWCVVRTLEAVGFYTGPYHLYVPSFGEWGFVLAANHPVVAPAQVPPGLRFITASILPTLFEFPDDMKSDVQQVNKLNNQILVRMFEEEWSEYVR